MIQIPENISTLSALCALQDTDLLSSIPGRQSNNKQSGGGHCSAGTDVHLKIKGGSGSPFVSGSILLSSELWGGHNGGDPGGGPAVARQALFTS